MFDHTFFWNVGARCEARFKAALERRADDISERRIYGSSLANVWQMCEDVAGRVAILSDMEQRFPLAGEYDDVYEYESDKKPWTFSNLFLAISHVLVFQPDRTSDHLGLFASTIEIERLFFNDRLDSESVAGRWSTDSYRQYRQIRGYRMEDDPLGRLTLAAIIEKNAGRFEIRGRRGEGEKGSRGVKADTRPVGSVQSSEKRDVPKSVRLDLTTARGIILINVPPNEVMSDLRERPLTNAAKAIVRSGDSLLMEAIRRAAPKYYGDYARSLPPMMFEPKFSAKSAQTENPNASLKTALVRVTDLKNRSIPGLTANDFEITESGTAREIESVERSTAPFNLVLLLDVSGSVENYVNFIRKAARAFVNTVDEKDRVPIVIFNDDVKLLSKFTTDKGKLSESLDTFDAGGGTAYYDALAYAVSDTLRQFKGERTAIVILTDGDDNRSFLAFDSLAGSIQESGALIYPLYVPSGLIAAAAANPNADIDPVRRKYMSVSAKAEGEGEKLARVSGGVYYPIKEIADIQKAYEDIVVQVRSAYNITFRSETSSGNSPRLKIKSKRDGTFATVTSVVASQ